MQLLKVKYGNLNEDALLSSRHSTLLRKAGICITEDFSGKGSMPPRQEEAASETPPSPQKKKQQPQSEPPAQPHLAATSPKKSPKKRAKNRNLGQVIEVNVHNRLNHWFHFI